MTDKYGTLDYSTVDNAWCLKPSAVDEMSLPITLQEGDVIRLGVLQGKAVKAVLLKGITSEWIWAISECDLKPQAGGFVALERPGDHRTAG